MRVHPSTNQSAGRFRICLPAALSAFLAAGFLIPLPCAAQAWRVRDINAVGASEGGSPQEIVRVGSLLLFSARHVNHGFELWRSDGTTDGTMLVKDIYPGPSDGMFQGRAVIGGTLFFRGLSPEAGMELWKTDGTTAGTVLVRDINPGVGGSDPSGLVVANNLLYFTADDGSTGRELWRTDGTTAGTVRVKDIWPGPNGGAGSSLTWVNGMLLFSASDGVTGYELWRSNGTAAGTVLVKDIYPGAAYSQPGFFTAVGGTIVFRAQDGAGGAELWITDGTTAGTLPFVDINPGAASSNPSFFAMLGGRLYFGADDGTNGRELWASDGTAKGTVLVKDINPGIDGSNLQVLTDVNGMLMFRADDGSNGLELWRSDGTAAGTVLVRDISPGSASATPQNFAVMGGVLYFAANNGTHGLELWRSDGTSRGTRLVADINPGAGSGGAVFPTEMDGVLYFSASDGVIGYELWASDGTSAGTRLVKDMNPGAAGSTPALFADVGGTLVFRADDGLVGDELWRTDGTLDGTVRLADLFPGADPSNPTEGVVAGGVAYYAAEGENVGRELFRSDGTPGGSFLVRDINPGPAGSGLQVIVAVGDRVFFRADDGTSGMELWISDGTPSGTVRVADLNPGSAASLPQDLTAMNDLLYFRADDGSHGQELWRSDGTAVGTVLVKDINPGAPSSAPFRFAVIGSTLFFSADDGTNGRELWRSNGTATGTVLVKDINPGSGGSNLQELTALGGLLLFAADDGGSGLEPWLSGGTSAGTFRLKDINPGAASSIPSGLTVMNGVGYFSADDGTHGHELWRSDGTAAGTLMVRDIDPGSGGTWLTKPGGLIDVYGTLLFHADDGSSGAELWRSDGTGPGTLRVQDIAPGGTGSYPTEFTVHGPLIYFRADDSVSGPELWAVPVSDISACADQWFADRDGDGYGDAGDRLVACNQPPGYVAAAGDCLDSNPAVRPGAPQLCDGINNDCSDPLWPALPAQEQDADGDGVRICAGDCDDANSAIRPGAPQVCDGVNNDCSHPSWPGLAGTNEADDDGDGMTECAGDCDDTRVARFAGHPEVCDGLDNDCDFIADDGDVCPTGTFCCTDIALVVDDTGSMIYAVEDLRAGLGAVTSAALQISGGDLRMGLVTFKDTIEVDLPLGTDLAALQAAVGAIQVYGGFAEPEASDEALNTVIHALPASARPPGYQLGDFNAFRDGCDKVAFLLTDARPGGFDDLFVADVDDVNAALRAQEAAAAAIRINAVHLLGTFYDPDVQWIMEGYATATGGAYLPIAPGGYGTAAAIAGAMESCGEPVGACCDGAGCLLRHAADCAAAGGVYKGDGTICSGTAVEADGDGDGVSECAGDCAPSDPTTYPGAPEINDGRDNQCAGGPGFGITDEISGDAGFHDPADHALYDWPAQQGATLYQVARADAADFSAGCTIFAGAEPRIVDPSTPAPGAALYYLVRPLSPHEGSWGNDSSGVARLVACGGETVCDDGVDEDLDGRTDCLDADCLEAEACRPYELTFVDTFGDDLGDTALMQFFSTLPADPGAFMLFEILLPQGAESLCLEEVASYRDRYLALAPTGGTAVSGPWGKWFRAPSTGGAWIGPDYGAYPSYYGGACYELFSWCPERGPYPGMRPTLRPAGISGCEAYDLLVGGCGDGSWRFTLRVGRSRFAACGF